MVLFFGPETSALLFIQRSEFSSNFQQIKLIHKILEPRKKIANCRIQKKFRKGFLLDDLGF